MGKRSVNNVGGGLMAADISAFTGLSGQLLFTSSRFPLAGGDSIDNIQFSSNPEPGILSLFVLGGLGFLCHRHKARPIK